jgi:hypothetical protein
MPNAGRRHLQPQQAGAGGTYNSTIYIKSNLPSGYGNMTLGAKYVATGDGPPTQPTCQISANPTSINQGSSSMLSWSSTDATAGTISGLGTVTLSGSQPVRRRRHRVRARSTCRRIERGKEGQLA